MPLVCHSYINRMYSYLIRMSLVYARILSVWTLMSFVCHSYVIVCYLYVTRIYSYVMLWHSYAIRMSPICTRISSLCHSHVLVCRHLYVVLSWTILFVFYSWFNLLTHLSAKNTFFFVFFYKIYATKVPTNKTVNNK